MIPFSTSLIIVNPPTTVINVKIPDIKMVKRKGLSKAFSKPVSFSRVSTLLYFPPSVIFSDEIYLFLIPFNLIMYHKFAGTAKGLILREYMYELQNLMNIYGGMHMLNFICAAFQRRNFTHT